MTSFSLEDVALLVMGHGDLQLHEATAGTERLSRSVLTKILFKMFYNMFRPNALSSCPHVARFA